MNRGFTILFLSASLRSRYGQGINHVLNITCQETVEIVSGVTDTVVGNTALREVVGTDLRTAVAGRNEALAAAGDIVNILLVLTVVDECIEAAQGTLLFFGWSRVSVHSMRISSTSPVLGFFQG